MFEIHLDNPRFGPRFDSSAERDEHDATDSTETSSSDELESQTPGSKLRLVAAMAMTATIVALLARAAVKRVRGETPDDVKEAADETLLDADADQPTDVDPDQGTDVAVDELPA